VRELRLTSVGLPISDLDEFRVIDAESLVALPDGQVGELICRGPYTIRGYFDADDINKAAFTEDGFYRTGDLVKVIEVEGHRSISMEGRIKDLINRGGEKISAEEVEGLLVRHPRIVSAAVVAMPDERLGERACAFLVAKGEPLSMAEVQAHLSGLGVAKFKWPERLVSIDEMPRTQVGKLDKNKLRSQLVDRPDPVKI
jgi:2,3-dihydroxybenzoate-AMP ligase